MIRNAIIPETRAKTIPGWIQNGIGLLKDVAGHVEAISTSQPVRTNMTQRRRCCPSVVASHENPSAKALVLVGSALPTRTFLTPSAMALGDRWSIRHPASGDVMISGVPQFLLAITGVPQGSDSYSRFGQPSRDKTRTRRSTALERSASARCSTTPQNVTRHANSKALTSSFRRRRAGPSPEIMRLVLES